MADNAVLVFVIDSDPAKKGAQDVVNALTGVQKKSKETAAAASEVGKSMKAGVPASQQLAKTFRDNATASQQLRTQLLGVNTATAQLKQLVGGLSAAFAVRELVRYSDEYKKLSGRLMIVSKDTGNFLALQRELNKTANESRVGIRGTTDLYSRLAQTTTRTTATQRDLLQVTDAISKGLAITGESAASAQGAMTQFTQGLATNFEAAGQEIRSLQEQAPRVAKALADGLNELGITANATSGDLMRLAKDGVITAENSIRALQTQVPKLNAEFAKIPLTVGQAFTALDNAFITFVGTNSIAKGATDTLAQGILLLADNLGLLTNAVTVAAVAYGVKLVAAYIQSSTQATVATRATILLSAQQLVQAESATVAAAAELNKARALAAGSLGMSTSANAAVVLAEANLATATSAQAAAGATLRLNSVLLASTGRAAALGSMLRASVGGAFAFLASPAGIAAVVAGLFIFGDEIQKAADKGNRFAQAVNVIRKALVDFVDFIGKYYLKAVDSISLGLSQFAEWAGVFEEGTTDILRNMQETRNASAELEQAATDLAGGGGGSGGGGTGLNGAADALKEFGKQLDKALKRERIQSATQAMSELQAVAAEVDAWVQESIGSLELLTKAQKEQVSELKKLRQANVAQEKFKQIIEDTRTPQEELNRKLKELEELRPFAKTAEEAEALDRAIKKLGEGTNPLAEIFKDTAVQIKNAFASAFESLFSGELRSWEDFAGSIKDIFVKMLAQMATLAIAKPIIVPIIQAVGSSIGLADADINSVVGELGGAGGTSSGGIGDLLGLGGMGVSGGFLSGIKDYINSAASDIFGTFSGVGPQLPGVDNTFTGILGETFSGSWGGAIANLLGLGSGNMLLDTGTSLAGAAIGNLIFPGIGGIVGSFAGTALGGLFGGKSRPHPASNFGAKGFSATGTLLDSVSSSKHTSTEAADALSKAVSQAVQGLAAGTGIDYSGINSFQGGVDDGRGFYSLGSFKDWRKGETFTFDPNKEGDAERALAETMLEMTRRVAGANGAIRKDLIPALDRVKVEGREAADIISDIALIANFDNIGQQLYDTTQQATAMEEVMKQVDAQFVAVRTSATELGLPLSELEAGLDNVRQYISTEFNAGLDEALLAIKNPLQSQLNGLLDEYYNMSRDAIAANGDVSKVNELFSLKALQLSQQYDTVLQGQRESITEIRSEAESLANAYSGISRSLADALVALRLGDLSTLSPKDKLEEARAKFLELSSKARSGDVDAANQLPTFANEFLKLSQSYFSSTGDFSRDFELVQQELQAAQQYAASQEQLQRQLVSTSTQQLLTLQTGFGDLSTILRNSNLTKVNSLANPNVLVSADNPNERVLALQGSLTQSQFAAAVEVLKATSPGVTPGQGTRSIFYEQNKAAAEQARAQLRNIIPGFATGTDYLRMGDLAMVGERGPELMTSRYDSRVIPMEHSYMVLSAIERNNMLMEESLREQEQQTLELRAQVVVLQDGMTRMLQQQGAIEQNTARAAQNATLQARRKD